MIQTKKILVPIDFSLHSKHAFHLALQIAKIQKCIVEVTHIFYGLEEAKPHDDPEFYSAYIERTQRVKERINKFIDDFDLEQVKIETSFQAWNPYEPLYKGVIKKEADLIVMGIKGTSGIDQVSVGSTASKVARFATCPVIVVDREYTLNDLDQVVFAFNFEELEIHSRSISLFQSWFPQTSIMLLRINTPLRFLSDQKCRSLFRGFQSQYNLENIHLELQSASNFEAGLSYFLKGSNSKMIAITSRGRSEFFTFLGGSAADDIVNNFNYPVWICNSHLNK